MRHFRLAILFICCLLLSISTLYAQKQKLEPEDYGQWQRIGGTELSPDGEWFGYNISLNDGDGWLIIKEVGADTTEEHKFMHGVRPYFSNDNQWAAFLIGVSDDEQEKLEEQNKSVRYKLGLMNLATTQVDTFKNVQSFQFSNNGHHLLMRKYKPEESNTDGADIIIRNLRQGTNQLVGNVSEYEFNKKGDKLALLLDATEDFGNGAHLYDLASNRVNILDSDTTNYKELSWNKEGTALAFLKERKEEDFKDPTHLVYAFRNLSQSRQKHIFDQQKFQTFPDSFRVVDYQEPRWSDDGEILFMGVKEWEKSPEESKKSETDSTAKKNNSDDLDPSNVEVWHWKDADIQPRQKVMADAERRSNYLSAWHLEDDKFVQLGSENREQLQLTGDQKHVVAYNPEPFEPAFEEDWREVYLIDVATGEEKKILERHEFVRTSPDGQYLLYFKNQNWWTYNISEDSHTNITGDIDSRFENFTRVNGREYRRPFGSSDWAEDDQWVLIYDRYDTYKVWTDGSDYNRLTEGAPDRIRFRYAPIDYGDDQDGLKNDQPIFFSMYGDTTKMRGYARYTDGKLETLMYEDQRYNRFSRADSTDRFVYQMQSATDSPDMYLVDDSFEDPVALTFTNPQQEDYYWADDELITFTNERGDQLEGRLLYPANYEPGETYPMITYIYENRSQTLHSYSMPSRKSPYNFRRFSSEGYFVFQPDINYELRDPGISAVESVVPAVEKVIDTGMINEDQIGLTGHSWGAYQTTFIITQTNLFNSAVAGAPLTNLISMYNSIYWNTGMTDAKIFETSQGRFPDPWWEDWDNFVDNSPIFNMEGVNTPLLVEFGTDDGAVDFNQGVELYNTMRRMQNPFVMLVYEGENHGLAREENQIDYATRAFQWHEHYLLGEEPADWITEGLPYLERPAIQEEE